MLTTCKNARRVFYHIIFLKICKSYKNFTKRFICKKRLLHWKSINGILLQVVLGKVGLSVAFMRYANSRKF